MNDDAIIDAVLPLIPRLGWTRAALAQAVGDAPQAAGDAGPRPHASDAGWAESAFPRGPRDAIAAWSALADCRMEAAAAAENLADLRVPQRIRRVIAIRLEQAEPNKEALRSALAILALPWNLPLAAKLTAATVNTMWHAAGDTSADFSWYTRRASLAAVYGSTLAYWLHDASAGFAPTLAFLDRRLADLGRLQKKT